MEDRSETKRMSLWGFIPLCLLSAAVGLFVFGFLGAALSNSDGLIVTMMLLGIITPVVVLIIRRKRPSRANAEKDGTLVPNAATVPQETSLNSTSGHRLDTMLLTLKSPRIWGLAIVGGIIFGVWNYISSGNNLGLQLIADRGGMLANGISILNTRSTPIKILDISVNGREDCYSYPPGREKELKEGDRDGLITRCEVMRVIVKTDRGTATFNFK